MDYQKYVVHAICRELSALKFVLHFVTVRKRSCGKVMFSEACVKNSVHRREGVHGRACVAGGMHGGGSCMAGWGGVAGGHAWRGDACMVGGMHGRGACMAGDTATAAHGWHPTGMHSC